MKEGEKISGRFQIPTEGGIIDIEISKGLVYEGADILDGFTYIPSLPQIFNATYEEAQEILKNSIPNIDTVDELTAGRWQKDDQLNRLTYPTLRIVPINILAVLDISSVARALSRNGLSSIPTLAEAEDERLYVPYVGPKRIHIAKALRDLAFNSLEASTTVNYVFH